jgi:tRNA U34 5-carboxymethylaminomethyl modifying GTPase MnmE/TrmE
MNNDTICALATANGIGALGIIRVSGDEALSVVQKSFPAKKLEKQNPIPFITDILWMEKRLLMK